MTLALGGGEENVGKEQKSNNFLSSFGKMTGN
jgi:hypothetical protein